MSRWWKWCAFAAGLAGVVLLGRSLGEHVPRALAWVDGLGAWGPLALVVLYTLGTVALVPGSLLTLAAGALFGLVRGTVFAFLGATCGAAAAFLVSRHLARSSVERRLAGDPRLRRIDEAIARRGRRVVLLLRLSPVFPFTLLNYALGLTRVRFVDYLLGCVGMLPGTLLYVYQGVLVGELAAVGSGGVRRGPGYYAVLLLGLSATLIVTVFVTRLARNALREESADGAVPAG